MKSLTMRDYDRQQRFADTRPYTPQGYSREHQTPHRSQRDEYEDPERPRKLARYTSPRVQHALPDSYSTAHARATGRPPVTGGAAGQGLRYTTSDYVNTQTTARQPVRVVKDSPPHQAVLTSVYRHTPSDSQQSSAGREADLKKSIAMLCCSVCGIDAQGPWRTGPLGPYSLCNACGSLPWKAEGVLSPSSIHEALSLLDNMRLMRLQQTSRQNSTPYISALLSRLQKGLPDSTFSRAEEYFARKAEAIRIAPSDHLTRIRHEHAAEQERIRLLQLKQHQAQLQARQLREREAQAREVERREAAALLLAAGTEVRNPTPPVADANRANGREPLKALPSPQRNAARETNIQSTEVDQSNALLKPAGQTSVTSQIVEQKAVPPTQVQATASSASQNASSSQMDGPAGSTATASRTFPLRTGLSADKEEEDSRSRIIDRRRARNEALRKEYLEQRNRRKETASPEPSSKTTSENTFEQASQEAESSA